jgi:hypothetical protein
MDWRVLPFGGSAVDLTKPAKAEKLYEHVRVIGKLDET